jgi:hypothetical protein
MTTGITVSHLNRRWLSLACMALILTTLWACAKKRAAPELPRLSTQSRCRSIEVAGYGAENIGRREVRPPQRGIKPPPV